MPRPALRRVERPAPEPQPVPAPVGDDLAAEAAPVAAEEASPSRGLFRRVADVFRGGPPAAAVAPSAPSAPAPAPASRAAVSRAAAPPAPRTPPAGPSNAAPPRAIARAAAPAAPVAPGAGPAPDTDFPPAPGGQGGAPLARMAVRDAVSRPAALNATPVVAGFPAAIARAGLGAVEERRRRLRRSRSRLTARRPAVRALLDGADDGQPARLRRPEERRDELRAGRGRRRPRRRDRLRAGRDRRRPVGGHRAGELGDRRRRAAPRRARSVPKEGGKGDADQSLEELYDRLKRELMIEQEQLGQLFHEP